ncbi:hypothetical protein E1287_29515 [Actinomadura sp. KC06]|uniref:hypothetical protein n=1 Tax=Actinomadura sp. KC06 TaxID=2530369 RepID=UPI001046336B|nr:hypothetical protein [Actinomadura sp. KC06]TDD30246.1 hypothetical protein E1287_29515 [Actinomadura sp. KC06]
MNGERRVAVAGTATVHARTPGDGAAPPSGTRPAERSAAGPEPPGSDPPDSDPLHTDSSRSVAVGGAAVSALIRRQLGIALRTCAIVIAVVAGLPALLVLAPAVAGVGVRGVPLFWLVLAFGVQPVWITVAMRQLRRAERAERDLTGPVACGSPTGRTPPQAPQSEAVGRP